jgi:hypothetical protein
MAVDDADLGQRTAAALFWFWIIHRLVNEGTNWFDRVLSIEGGISTAKAYALLQGGFFSTMVRQNDLESCRAQIHEARAIFAELKDQQGELMANNYDGVMLWWLRGLDASQQVLTNIQLIHQSVGYEWETLFAVGSWVLPRGWMET